MVNTKSNQSGFLQKLPKFFGGQNVSREKERLEAFLDAVPGEYCGFGADGSIAYSAGFCKFLMLDQITSIHDIEDGLYAADAAALEGVFEQLQKTGEPFSLTVQDSARHKTLKLSGHQGKSLNKDSTFTVLWLEDITVQEKTHEGLKNQARNATANHEKLQSALNALPMPMWIRNEKGALVWVNTAYADVLNLSPRKVVMDYRELPFRPVKSKNAKQKDTRKRPPQTIADDARTKNKIQIERLHLTVDGDRKLMELSEVPFADGSSTLGMAQDISKEEQLEQDYALYSSSNYELLEQLGTAIGIFDANGHLEFANGAFERLWKLEDAYLNTHPALSDIMDRLREMRRLPEQIDFRQFKQSWLDMFTSLIAPHEDMLYLPDGTILRMLSVPYSKGGGLMMIFEDVSSHLALESSYNTLIQVQKETLDSLSEGVVVFGSDGRVKLWNPAFANLWDLHPEELENTPHITKMLERMKTGISADDWEENKEKLLAQALSRQIMSGQMALSDDRHISYHTLPLPDGAVMTTHSDITDTVRVETALREKNAALEDAERLKIDFLANVSYQLRTPLNAIMGFAEILYNEYFGKMNGKQKDYASNIKESGETLLRLIDDILDLSSIEAGYMELYKSEVSVNDTLTALQDLMLEWARKENINITFIPLDKDITMMADEKRLKQALLNVIRNAIAYTEEGGSVDVGVKKTKGNIVFIIKDTGSGISKEDLKHIFMPFEKGRRTTTRGGVGLGLALVKNITELHGGHVKISSAVGKGTTIKIELPITA